MLWESLGGSSESQQISGARGFGEGRQPPAGPGGKSEKISGGRGFEGGGGSPPPEESWWKIPKISVPATFLLNGHIDSSYSIVSLNLPIKPSYEIVLFNPPIRSSEGWLSGHLIANPRR